MKCTFHQIYIHCMYSRTSVARTLMARLPQLLRTRSRVPNKKNPTAADIIVFGIILGDFLSYIDNGMLCVFIRIASTRRF